MDSKTIKIMIFIIIILIAGLFVLIHQLIMTNNIIEENERLQKQNQTEKNETTVTGIKNSKVYKSLISKVDNNNIYIDMEIDKYTNEKIIVALKDNNIYVSNGNIDIISKNNNVYVINHEQKIISEKKDAKLEIRQIINIPETTIYDNLQVIESSEYVIDKTLDCETIENLDYYFENEQLKYIKSVDKDNTFYKVNILTEVTNEEIFNLPLEYDIIDGKSINIENII